MNPDSSKKIKVTSSKPAQSLGEAQIKLEETTREHLAAQAAYQKALDRLTSAEEEHTKALESLVNEVSTLRTRCKVPNIVLK